MRFEVRESLGFNPYSGTLRALWFRNSEEFQDRGSSSYFIELFFRINQVIFLQFLIHSRH